MTVLRIPDPLEIYCVNKAVHLRLPVAAPAGETDARWRRVYNGLATGAGIPVEALGNEDRTVLIVSLPAGTSPEDVATHLSTAAALLGDADENRKAELALYYGAVEVAAQRWCKTYRDQAPR
jgi:hypothetical protein